MNTPPSNPVSLLNSARQQAAIFRAEWLMLIHDEIMSLSDLMHEAEREESKALLRLTLRQILLAQPGWGRRKTNQILDHILSVLGAKIDRRQLTAGWLIDPRSGGRRYASWLDAFEEKRTPPWPGFPHARGHQHV